MSPQLLVQCQLLPLLHGQQLQLQLEGHLLQIHGQLLQLVRGQQNQLIQLLQLEGHRLQQLEGHQLQDHRLQLELELGQLGLKRRALRKRRSYMFRTF